MLVEFRIDSGIFAWIVVAIFGGTEAWIREKKDWKGEVGVSVGGADGDVVSRGLSSSTLSGVELRLESPSVDFSSVSGLLLGPVVG